MLFVVKGLSDMKWICLVFSAILASVCFGMVDSALPPSEFADTEVSTNFVFAVGEGGGCRLVFSLELQAAPTNNVEVAIGHDANGDGYLSLDEAALAVGYDCGEWFVRSVANDSVTYSDAAISGTFRRTYEVRSRNVDPLWNLVKVTRRGLGVANESVGVELKPHGFGVTIW